VAEVEHTRWYEQRLKPEWNLPGDSGTADNPAMVPWAELPEVLREGQRQYLKGKLTQLEEAGFIPIVDPGGPPGSANYTRAGTVRARRLSSRRRWSRTNGDELCGSAGDWRVTDQGGDDRTVRDEEFRASHTHLGGDRWSRTGVFRAWQVSERTVVRTLEGRSTAEPGDWIVQGPTGVRWPVADRQFRRSYQPEPEVSNAVG
jgi:hypothetical protein